jgi:hypothetical protein
VSFQVKSIAAETCFGEGSSITLWVKGDTLKRELQRNTDLQGRIDSMKRFCVGLLLLAGALALPGC